MFHVHTAGEHVHIPLASLKPGEQPSLQLPQRVLDQAMAKFTGSVSQHGYCVHVSALQIKGCGSRAKMWVPMARTDAQLLVPAMVSLVYASPGAGKTYAARVTGVYPGCGLLVKVAGIFDGIVSHASLAEHGFVSQGEEYVMPAHMNGGTRLRMGLVMNVVCTHVVYDNARKPYCIATLPEGD